MTLWLALRYLRPRRSFITIISSLSVLGIVIGTAALIIVMSIFNGFREVATSMMTHFGPHASIVPTHGSTLANASHLVAKLPSHATGIPLVESSVVILHRSTTSVGRAVGIRPEDAPRFMGVRTSTIIGSYSPIPTNDVAGLVIGAMLADRLSLFPGDTVTLLSPRQIEQAILTMAQPKGVRAVVRGLFQSNSSREADDSWLVTDAATVQRLTGSPLATSVHVTLPDPSAVAPFQELMQGALGNDVQILSWKDMNKGLYDTMRLERIGSFIVLSLIIVVAVFNVLVSLTLGVTEKRRDIAVLKTAGASDVNVRRVWMWQGLILGVGATIVGCSVGTLLALGQQHFGWIALGGDGYLVPTMPAVLDTADVLATALVSIVLASLAAVYPARRASGLRIADAIRME